MEDKKGGQSKIFRRKSKPKQSEEVKKSQKRQRLQRELEALEEAPPKDLRSKQTFLNLAAWGKQQ